MLEQRRAARTPTVSAFSGSVMQFLLHIMLFTILVVTQSAACIRSDSQASGNGGAEAIIVQPTVTHAKMINCTLDERRSAQCVHGTCYVTELDGMRGQPACQCYSDYTGKTCKFLLPPKLPTQNTEMASVYITVPVVLVIVIIVAVIAVVLRVKRGRWNCFAPPIRRQSAYPGASREYATETVKLEQTEPLAEAEKLLNGTSSSTHGAAATGNGLLQTTAGV